jgi:hypothetical protein
MRPIMLDSLRQHGTIFCIYVSFFRSQSEKMIHREKIKYRGSCACRRAAEGKKVPNAAAMYRWIGRIDRLKIDLSALNFFR